MTDNSIRTLRLLERAPAVPTKNYGLRFVAPDVHGMDATFPRASLNSLRALERRGFAERDSDGRFTITEAGRDYLRRVTTREGGSMMDENQVLPVCCCMAPHVPCEIHESWLFDQDPDSSVPPKPDAGPLEVEPATDDQIEEWDGWPLTTHRASMVIARVRQEQARADSEERGRHQIEDERDALARRIDHVRTMCADAQVGGGYLRPDAVDAVLKGEA